MKICEMFGPTIQGEGPHAGQRVGFLRFAGCNLACSWCDTPYSWDWTRYNKDIETFDADVNNTATSMLCMNVRRFVITGGEPMMQQEYISLLYARTGMHLDVETNGTIIPTQHTIDAVSLFVVSPKLSNSGDRASKRIKPDALKALQATEKAAFKFVCSSTDDLDEVQTIVDDNKLTNIWIMPEGATRAQQRVGLTTMAQHVIDRGWNLSPRLHVLIWDTQRGV
jgi:organic radical activating enzyme